MRVAALYDIHGNLPALWAVLAELACESWDRIVVEGDVATGPLPRETIEQVMALGERAQCVRGNADREIIDAHNLGRHEIEAEYEAASRTAAFAASRISRSHRDFLAGFAPHVRLDLEGLRPALVCHGSPRATSLALLAHVGLNATSERPFRHDDWGAVNASQNGRAEFR